MFHLIIPSAELWDEGKEEFINTDECTLTIEHSLVSLSKWESKWCRPFLSGEVKSTEETIDYVRCMTLEEGVDPDIYRYLTDENINEINSYIGAPMTATTFAEDRNALRNRERITSELIYYWMVALNIPFECQYWHLNRLLTLIRVCSIKNKKPRKMGMRELMSRNAALNAERRKKLNSKG